MVIPILLSLSCYRNQLKTNEKKLANEISSKEKEKEKKEAERIAQENQDQDTLANILSGFQYKEDRSIDSAHPPVVIDFSKNIPVKEIKLGDIVSKVSYLVLQVPDDSIYFLWGSRLNFTPNSIIVNNNLVYTGFPGKEGLLKLSAGTHLMPRVKLIRTNHFQHSFQKRLSAEHGEIMY